MLLTFDVKMICLFNIVITRQLFFTAYGLWKQVLSELPQEERQGYTLEELPVYHRDRQPHTFRSIKSIQNHQLTHHAWLWTVGASWNNQQKPTQAHANSKSQQKNAQTEPFLCDCPLTISPLCFFLFGYWVNTFAWQLKV